MLTLFIKLTIDAIYKIKNTFTTVDFMVHMFKFVNVCYPCILINSWTNIFSNPSIDKHTCMFLTVHMSTYVFYTSSPDNQQHILLNRYHLNGGTGLCRHILRMFCCSCYHTILSHKLEHNNYNCIQCTTTVFLFFLVFILSSEHKAKFNT